MSQKDLKTSFETLRKSKIHLNSNFESFDTELKELKKHTKSFKSLKDSQDLSERNESYQFFLKKNLEKEPSSQTIAAEESYSFFCLKEKCLIY